MATINQTRIGDLIPDYRTVITQFEKKIAFLYPDIAYYMDPITLDFIDDVDDVESDKVATFKCFAYKYF